MYTYIYTIYNICIGFRVHEVCLATRQLETQVGHELPQHMTDPTGIGPLAKCHCVFMAPLTKPCGLVRFHVP